MAAHRVAEDSGARDVDRKAPGHERHQLVDEIALHAPVAPPRLLGRVEIPAPTPKSHEAASPGTFAPRGLVSGAMSAMPSLEAMRCAPDFAGKVSSVQVSPAR